ncbi:hypothetical protein GGI07_001583 [Coemansia sp. Benny D115]|nr:hypothetical protein GGI07_001583 [Coemansia sp. Benny D115]
MDTTTDVQPKYAVDIDALFADYVKEATIETGYDSSEISRRMFARAASITAEDAAAQVVFIECREREHLVQSVRSETIIDSSGLERVAIKYATTLAMLRALLAAWHCERVKKIGALTESQFLVWSDECDGMGVSAVETLGAPDYLLIDGLDAVVDEESAPGTGA